MRFRGRARPISVFDDVAVPPDHLAEVLQRLQNLLQQQNVTWTLDANAGEGRLRFRPFFNLSDPGDRAKLEPLACRVYDIVLEAGGTISSSEGCGLLRTQFLRRQYGELVQMFREIKDAFDPLDQLNPGKVIGDDPHLMLHNLRPGFTSSVSTEPESGTHQALGLSGSGEVPIDPASQESLFGRRQTTNPESEPGIRRRSDGHPACAALARTQPGRNGIIMPRLRHVPDARAGIADVSELSGFAARSGVAAKPRRT